MSIAANEFLVDTPPVIAAAVKPPKLAVVAKPGGSMKPVIMKWTMCFCHRCWGC